MTSPQRSRTKKILTLLGLGLVGLLLLAVSETMCISAYLFDGILVPVCPDGDPVQTAFIESSNLRRGSEGYISVGAIAHYTTEAADAHLETYVRRREVNVFFVKPDGTEVALPPKEDWTSSGHADSATIILPEVPDGEYTLRARVKTPLGESTADAALPVFAPARIHVLTDRPLYEPGNTVQFRAVVLRAKDLAPLDGRPGRWVVTDPQGETVLEEKAPAGDFGVVSGSFPLDVGAAVGDWSVAWVSGAAQERATFRVEPFALPRFSIEAQAAKLFYRANEKPVVRGKVKYSSGAPVRDAQVEILWSVNGNWPPPSEWMEGGLPRFATTDNAGAFELDLPRIPGDLRGRVTLYARLAAVDAAKDRVEGGASVLLSEDAIQVSAVTELDDGLVQGFNNRIYLRATTASGSVLSNTELFVKRAWEPGDKGVKAITDEDGVASLQVDPGPPVNVVIPPMPWRPPPRPPAVVRGSVHELITDESPGLVDLRAMDLWNEALGPCSRFVRGSETASFGLRADPSGAIETAVGDSRPMSQCAVNVLRARKLAATGKHRIYQVDFTFNSDQPSMRAEVTGTPFVPDGLEAAFEVASLDARSCLPRTVEAGMLPRLGLWTWSKDQRQVAVRFAPDPVAEGTPNAAVAGCAENKLSNVTLAARAGHDEEDGGAEGPAPRQAMGVVRFMIDPAAADAATRPTATTMLGYELSITARAKDEELGKTKLFLQPGAVPYVRLRATPVLAQAGQEVEVAILRGPSFSGDIPEKMWLQHEKGGIEGNVDPKTRIAKFQLPTDRDGWFTLDFSGARALVYVRPAASLEVAVKPGADRYAPGDTAALHVNTTSRGKGTPAAVGLFGVDSSLGQLATLPGSDEMARLQPKAEMRSSAFEVLDAAALALGRIRGSNAAAATILRVSSVPAYVDLDANIYATARPAFDPVERLTDHFYAVLSELHEQTRTWEEKAPEGEEMLPATMAGLWKRALDACEQKQIPVTDAFGRKLRLHRLPDDLLALTDPRMVVVDGARLPEDVENWPAWVKKEQP